MRQKRGKCSLRQNVEIPYSVTDMGIYTFHKTGVHALDLTRHRLRDVHVEGMRWLRSLRLYRKSPAFWPSSAPRLWHVTTGTEAVFLGRGEVCRFEAAVARRKPKDNKAPLNRAASTRYGQTTYGEIAFVASLTLPFPPR